MAELSPVARALLETIAGPESQGDYNILYGGGQFDSFEDHPRQPVLITSGPNKGQYSSAAGKYQFLGSTWDDIAERYDIPDFSPANQDQAAWALATEEYKRDTGRDLEADLAAGDLSRVAPSLRNQWTSLPGGIEQGIGGSAFANAYASNLNNPTSAQIAIDHAMLPDLGPPGSGKTNGIGTMPAFGDMAKGGSAWGGIMRPAQPKGGNLLTAALDGIGGGIGNLAYMAGQQAGPIMRGAQAAGQQAAPSIMKAALGSIAGRSAIIDPMIQRVFSNGSSPAPGAMAAAQRAVAQSGDNSTGNQAEAAAARASAQAWRDSRR